MKIRDWFEGVSGLLLAAFITLLAVLFFFVFNLVYATAVSIILVIAILILPYYFGRKNEPEKKDNYDLKQVKE